MKQRWILGVLVVAGCAKRVAVIPPESTVSLAGQTAVYRPWQRVDDLCLVPAPQFVDEQKAMATLQAEWLGKTSATADGAWDDEHLALLEEGARVLPDALESQRLAFDRAAKCGFEGLAVPREMHAQTTRRVAEAPDLVAQVRARLAIAKWKELRPGLQATAFDENCRLKAAPKGPILYFATEDETARMEWLFCDGAKVVASIGNPPAFEASTTAKKTKKDPEPKLYLELAARYPGEQINRAPKPWRRQAERDVDPLEPTE